MEAISQQDLEQVAFIYDQIKNFLRSKELESSKTLSDDLETIVNGTMSEISSKICEDLSPSVLELHNLNSRYQLFKFCAEKMLLVQEDESCKIWNQIFIEIEKTYNQILTSSLKIAENVEKISSELTTQKKENEDILQAAEELEKTATVIN